MTTIETAEQFFAALMAWDAWEHAVVTAQNKTLNVNAQNYREIVDAAWSEVERLHSVAKSYEVPCAFRRMAEQRVMGSTLAMAREAAEERVRVYTKPATTRD